MLIFYILLLFLSSTQADTPVHCLYEDTIGEWILHIGSRGHDKNLDCGEKLGLSLFFNIFYCILLYSVVIKLFYLRC